MTSNMPRNNPNADTMKDKETGMRGADRKPGEDKDGNVRGQGFGGSDGKDAATRDASRESESRRGQDGGSKGHPDSRRHTGADDASEADGSASTGAHDDPRKDDATAGRKTGGMNQSKDSARTTDSDRTKGGQHNA